MSFESKVGAVKTLGQLAIAGAAIYAGYWVYKNRDKFNPVSDKNVAYQGASDVGRSVANLVSDNVRPEDTVGTLAFDAVDTVKSWFGFGEAAREAERQKEVQRQIEARKQQASDVGRAPLTFDAPDGTYQYNGL